MGTNVRLAYVALGHMAVQLGSKMRPFIDDVIRVIKDHLRQRGYVRILSGPLPTLTTVQEKERSIRSADLPVSRHADKFGRTHVESSNARSPRSDVPMGTQRSPLPRP